MSVEDVELGDAKATVVSKDADVKIKSSWSTAQKTLEWRNLRKTVAVKNVVADSPSVENSDQGSHPASGQRQANMKEIIKGVSGSATPGELVAIMGASGAGKTTLLNILAGRSRRFEGELLVNGKRMDKNSNVAAYVQQNDIFIKTLTVREHLHFQAELRMDRSIEKSDREARVEETMRALGLAKCGNTLIGGDDVRGISGGERKRVSFASEIITDPSLLFADEPTSGLDSYMAASVVESLRTLAEAGRTVIATIHQPSTEVFNMFDKLILIAEGEVAYMGSVKGAIQFFKECGYPVPEYTNPADHYIKTLSVIPKEEEASRKRIRSIVGHYNATNTQDVESGEKEVAGEEMNAGVVPSPESHPGEELSHKVYQASWGTQFRALFKRSAIAMTREPILTKARLGQAIVLGIICGLIFLQVEDNQKSVQNKNGALFFILINQSFGGLFGVLQTFPLEVPVFQREHKNGMYRPSAYYLARTMVEIPFQFVFPIIFCSIAYWMIGLNPTADRFLMFLLTVALTSNVAISLGFMISTMAPTVSVALAVGPVIILPFLLFGGFFVNKDSIPVYFRWLSSISFFNYGFEAAVVNEWSGTTIGCTNQEIQQNICRITQGEQVISQLSFSEDNLWINIFILIGLLVGFRLLSFYFLWRRSRQEEKDV